MERIKGVRSTLTCWAGFAGLCLLLLASACAAGRQQQAQTPTLPLWHAHWSGGDYYLLGSVHVGTSDVYPLDPAIEAAFASSQELIVEVEPREIEGAASLFAREGRLPPGQDFATAVGAELAERTKAVSGRLGLPWEALQSARPWWAALSVSLTFLEQQGYSADLGIDQHFLSAAGSRGMPVFGLETAQEQVALLAELPMALQRDLLSQALDEVSLGEDGVGAVLTAWREGDTERMQADLLEPMRRGSPELFERFFTARNHRMVASLQSRPRATRAFVVVGTGHLLGSEGMLSLLRAQGIRVEAVGPQRRARRLAALTEKNAWTPLPLSEASW